MSFNYNDIIVEIEMLEERIRSMEKEREFLRQSMFDNSPQFNGVASYGKERVKSGYVPLSLDVIVERLNKIDDNIDKAYQLLYEKRESKNRIDSMLGKLEGLEYKVAYMRDVKRMPLQEIADELGYSVIWIKKLSSRVKKSIPRVYPKQIQ